MNLALGQITEVVATVGVEVVATVEVEVVATVEVDREDIKLPLLHFYLRPSLRPYWTSWQSW